MTLSRVRPWVSGAAALLASLLPLGFALALAAATPQWRDDVAVVRGLGLSVAPGAGAVATLLTWTVSLLPLGGAPLKAALVAALGLSAVGYLLHGLIEKILDEVKESALNPLVALVASAMATLSPPLLREATVGGGATVGLALALWALVGWDRRATERGAGWVWLGAMLGLLVAENAVLSVAVALALLARGMLLRPRCGQRELGLGAAGFGAAAVLVLLPAALRPLSPTSWVAMGLAHGFGELRALDVASMRGRGLGAWASEVGVSAFALTALGVVCGVGARPARWLVAPLLAPLALDLLAPATSSGVLTPDPLGPLRALSLCTASAAAALGAQQIFVRLRQSKLPLARPAAVLSVAFHATLAVMAAEEGTTAADRGRNSGASVWTDQALENLPPSALVIARSDALLWRLWAARLGSGMRPDVTVVPLPLLGRGKLASALLQEEPALAPLLRDISATGTLSEFGLSSVADVRPLFVELDPQQDRRLASHVTDERLWLRFAPQPCGLSDRKASQATATATFYRVVAAARRDEPHDEATLEILASHAREVAAASAAAQDRESAQQAMLHLAALHREPPADDPLWLLIDPSRRPVAPHGRRARR